MASETYICTGQFDKTTDAQITLPFEDLSKVKIATDENDYELDFSSENSKYKIYGDYGYDGYGGFVDLRVPRNFAITGSDAAEEFRGQFQIQTYSELGHVASQKFVGDCQRTDN
jgi:hypothetical protein